MPGNEKVVRDPLMNPESLRKDLSPIVGEDRVTTDPFERMLYGHDLAPIPPQALFLFKTLPDVVVRPLKTEEIIDIVKYAHRRKIPIVPRGAASWGFGGAVPVKGGIVLDLTAMNRIFEINKESMTAVVEAGLSWKKLLEAVEKEGFTVRTYPTSAPSATIGGWINTSGLGVGSLKYGHLREHVLEIEVVMPNGDVTRFSKDKLDWLLGSEGTLGIITKVILRIYPKPEVVSPHSVCFDDIETMCSAIFKLLKKPVKPYFIEFIDKEYLEIKRSLDLFAPDSEAYAIFTFEGDAESVEKEEQIFRNLITETGTHELDSERAREEWEERFYPMRIKRAGPTLLAGEILVPVQNVHSVINDLWRLGKNFKLKMGIEGVYVSKGSCVLMPMILADERKGLKYLSTMPLAKEITEIGLRSGGKPFGGFGIWNSFYLKKVYNNPEIKKIKERKKKLDPDDVMNPGKLYQVKTKFGFPFTLTMYRFIMFLLKFLGKIV